MSLNMGKWLLQRKCSNAASLNNTFGLTCLHDGAEARDLGQMQMSDLSYFQHVLIHLELAAE